MIVDSNVTYKLLITSAFAWFCSRLGVQWDSNVAKHLQVLRDPMNEQKYWAYTTF